MQRRCSATEKLGLVDIVTRMDTHRTLAELAFRHGVPAIVQKPFAPNWADCVAIVKAAEKAGLFLAVHENFRFQTPLQKVKELLDSGVIGEPSWARISFRTGYDIYKGQPYFYDEERFVILDLGIHVVDVARFLLGEAERVSCETQRRNPKVKAEDTATICCGTPPAPSRSSSATYEAKKLPDPFPETMIEIEGPRGAIVTKPGYRMEVTVDGKMTASEIEIPLPSLGESALAHDRGERLQDLRAPPGKPARPGARRRPRGATTSRPTRSAKRPTNRPRPDAR